MIDMLMDWLAANGGTLVTVVFFTIFLVFGFWAYRPANKSKMESYGRILFKE